MIKVSMELSHIKIVELFIERLQHWLLLLKQEQWIEAADYCLAMDEWYSFDEINNLDPEAIYIYDAFWEFANTGGLSREFSIEDLEFQLKAFESKYKSSNPF